MIRFPLNCRDVQALSDSLTRGVVVQRKSPGMEGSREVERAPADNGSVASPGKPELKSKKKKKNNLFLRVYGSQNGSIGTLLLLLLLQK